MISQRKTIKTLVLASSAALAFAALAGCSKSDSSPTTAATSESPIPTPSATPSVITPSATKPTESTSVVAATCTTTAVKAALPSGATLNHYNCVKGYVGAYATTAGKKSGYIFKSEDGKLVNVTEMVCGTASGGLGTVILSYCPQ